MKKRILHLGMSFLFLFVSLLLAFPQLNHNQKPVVTTNYASKNLTKTNRDFTYEAFKNLIEVLGITNDSPIFNLIKEINHELYPEKPEITLSEAISQNIGTLTPKIVDQLFAYDSQHPEGWTLNFKGSNWNNLDLLLLEAFGDFSNIQAIQIEVSQGKISQSVIPFDITTFTNINLFEKLSNIERLQFKFSAPINFSNKISYEDFLFLAPLENSLMHLDVSTLVDAKGISIFDNTPPDTNWFIEMPFGFKMWVPYDTKISSDPFNTYQVDNKVDLNGLEFKEITKNASRPVPLPSHEDHENIIINEGSDNQIIVQATLYENNWYWMLEDRFLLTYVLSHKKNTRFYYTTLKIGEEYELVSRRVTPYPESLSKEFLEGKEIALPPSEVELTPENIKATLNTPIYINDEPYFYMVSDGIAYLEYDVRKIKFASYGQNKFYTTLNNALPTMVTDLVGSTKSSDYEYKVAEKVDLEAPASPYEQIKYDNKVIETIVVDSNFYWNFAPSEFQSITYYSASLKHFFSSVEAVLANDVFPTDLTLVNLPTSYPVLKNSLVDFGPITINNYQALDTTILIDENTIAPVLRRGYIYWDYDIEKVKYVVEENEIKHYFTNFEAAQTFSDLKYAINSIIRPQKRFIPQPEKIIEPSVVSSSTLRIDDYTIKKVLRDGEFYWNNGSFDIELASIKYVNENGYYFTSLPIDMLDSVISEVSFSGQQEKPMPSKYSPFYQNNKQITISNFDVFLKPLIIDRIPYDFKFLDSQPLLPVGVDPTKIKYAVNFEDVKSNEFLTEIDILNYSRISESNNFSVEHYDSNTQFPTLSNPQSKDETKVFINNEGIEITIAAVPNEDEATFSWNNPIIDGANYLLVNNEGQEFYANNLNEKTMANITKVSSLNRTEPLSFAKTTPVTLERDYQDIALYLIISLVSLVLVLGVVHLAVLLTKKEGKV